MQAAGQARDAFKRNPLPAWIHPIGRLLAATARRGAAVEGLTNDARLGFN